MSEKEVYKDFHIQYFCDVLLHRISLEKFFDLLIEQLKEGVLYNLDLFA